MTLEKKDSGIFLDDTAPDLLNRIDAVIFDCDGVLIDITKSYDLTIVKTTQYFLKNFAKIENAIELDFSIIDGFKSTGGFNDEVDLTYAAILCIVAAKKLMKNQREFIFDVIANSNSMGIVSVEKYIETLVDISSVKKILSYPGKHEENLLYKIFDQIFYGPELYSNIYKQPSQFSEPGLIEQDDVILTENLIEQLSVKFSSKIALVTGRGKKSVGFSLQQLLEKFDLEHSFFLEDESRDLAKPNPKPLLDSITGMNSKFPLYVGDSMEDFLMVKKINNMGYSATFCGIMGTSKNPNEKLSLFEKNGASIVINSIDQLPKILNLE